MALRFYVVGRERRRANAAGTVPEAAERRGQRTGECNYIALPDRRVSRRHAEIYVVGGRVFVRDLGSKNGTYLVSQGRRTRLTEGFVDPRQTISFGGYPQCIARLVDVEAER